MSSQSAALAAEAAEIVLASTKASEVTGPLRRIGGGGGAPKRVSQSSSPVVRTGSKSHFLPGLTVKPGLRAPSLLENWLLLKDGAAGAHGAGAVDEALGTIPGANGGNIDTSCQN